MKKTIFTLALLLAASTAAFADETDPNPQPAPTPYATGTLYTTCGATVPNVLPAEAFASEADAGAAYRSLAQKACGDSDATWIFLVFTED